MKFLCLAHMINNSTIFRFIIGLCIGLNASAQITSTRLRQYISDETKISSHLILFSTDVKNFYNYQNFQVAWMNYGQESARTSLLRLFRSARQLGLNEEDYTVGLPVGFIESQELIKDSMMAEILLTDAALHYFRDILYGNTSPQIGYNGLKYRPDCFDIPLLLSTYLKAGKLDLLVNDLELRNPQYLAIKNKIIWFDHIVHLDNYKNIPISSTSATLTNSPLLTKLYQLNIIDSVTKKLSVTQLKEKIKEAQNLFGLLPDGVLRSNLINELNVSLETRIEELKLTLHTIRWLTCMINNESTIVVNIPSATLQIYEQGKIILESKIIAGKKSTPTPTLISKVNEVILYPYWIVPNSIAVKELLPMIRRNPSYVNSNGYQVLNKNGRIIDPYSISWHSLGPGNFPYIIRQSTGCDNALGLIKLNFYNPYSVYLHDTPSKSLFNVSKRYFSHGCMRVEKAMELAHLLLAGNTIAVDTLEQKGCLRNQSPITVPATQPVSVVVLYNTAWFNGKGEISFSEDIYNKNQILYRNLLTSDKNRN